MDYCLAASVELGEILDDILREEVPLETLRDETVGDAPKCILQVKKGYVCRPLLLLCIFDHFIESYVVLYASIDTREKGLLHCWIDKVVLDEEGSEAGVEEEMEGLADTATEGNHPEVGGVSGIALLVDELYHRLPPGGGWGAQGKHFCKECGQDVVSTL